VGWRPAPTITSCSVTAIEEGVAGAVEELRSPLSLIGSAGYMLFDIAVLALCFPAFGLPLPPLVALMLAYIIGQLGGLVPLPGGAGGLDLGLIGALVLYGSSAADATVAVLAYRALYLVVPAALGLRPRLPAAPLGPARRPTHLLRPRRDLGVSLRDGLGGRSRRPSEFALGHNSCGQLRTHRRGSGPFDPPQFLDL
jgi:lysylphosphatidylglycerol synthase-like protein